jgi:hypothetical protein
MRDGALALQRAVGNRAVARLVPARELRLARCGCGGGAGSCRCLEEEIDGPASLGERALHRAVLAGRLSRAGERRLSRRVGRVGCTAGVASAPDDPAVELQDIDGQAHDMAVELADDFAADAATVRAGIPDTPSASLQSYIDRFGLPVAQGRGFLNRITGLVAPTLEAATSGELRILSRRFRIVARILGDRINYICGDAQVTLGGCAPGDCGAAGVAAFTCRGASSIAICPPFWRLDELGLTNDNTARAANVVHELFHMIWGISSPRGVGEVGDETLRGPGRNFDVAGCYQALLDDVFGADSGGIGQCPPVP